MSMAEQIKQLHELHQSGALSDEEFAKAKDAVLAGKGPSAPAPAPVPPPVPAPAGERPWGCLFTLLVLAVVGFAAWKTNPTEASFQGHLAKQAAPKGLEGLFKQLAEGILLPAKPWKYNNLYVCSVVTVPNPLGEEAVYVGAFGNWWRLK